MDNKEFAHLHVHTDASLRDGLGTVDRLLNRVKEMEFEYIAITDHGTLANAILFANEAGNRDLKARMGMEGYVEFDGVIGHITLLANGMKGWHSLLTLNNLAHESEWRSPAFTIDELIKHNDNLVCLTGCIASPLQQLPYKDAYRLGGKLKGAFGGRLYSELMFVGDSLGWERPLKLAKDLRLQKVMTNDVHFPLSRDSTIHPILTRMKAGFDYDSSQLYLRSANQMKNAATSYGLPEDEVIAMLHKAQYIAEKLEPVELKGIPDLPETDKLKSIEKEVYSGVRNILLTRPEYLKRYNKEMKVISDMGFESYFQILNDILVNAREIGARIGPGRGSGAGSLVLYLLGITDIDPIKYGLQFERFLNPERIGMPDVDVDIDSENREAVLEYAKTKWDAIPISTYSRYSHKSLTRDLGKSMGADKELITNAADKGTSSKEFKELCRISPTFESAYEAFMGQIRHKGKHAGGVIITDVEVPIERVSNGLAAAWTEGRKNELSSAGIVKFDLLGLSVLAALRRLEVAYPKVLIADPKEGDVVFQIFRKGDLSGIFQFSGSEGIRKLTMDLAPNKFEDLIAINALYRPGAIDAKSTEKYPEWKKHPRSVPLYIRDILEETYGAIVYQEQVMSIFQRTVDGTLADADLARKLLSKAKPDDPKWVEDLSKARARFIAGATTNHELTPDEALDLWEELETHSRYSFNKSHSTAYAMIAWECAFWKTYFPEQFFAAMLNTDPQQEQTYIIDAVKAGFEIRPPHVNISTNEWIAEKGGISMPLSAIKFLGQSGVVALLEQRKEAKGKFKSIKHFMEMVPKRFVRASAREGLLALNGFYGLFKEPTTTDEIIKTLAIKTYPDPTMKIREKQLKYLGVIIPTEEMLKSWEDLEATGWICGIIKNKDMRESKWGPYAVYRLSPNGVFWSRKVMDLEKGEVVAVDVSKKNGRAKRIKLV